MSAGTVALAVGTILAVASLAFVLYPLFFSVTDELPSPSRATTDESAIQALREIEFDRATGKLSEADYLELKKSYSARALQELRGSHQRLQETATPQDDIEARARAFRLTHRECHQCGVRPEPDAMYCSTCGTYLERVCPRCSAEVTTAGATYCPHCGATLATRRPATVA